jgi:cytochrome P450 PksS
MDMRVPNNLEHVDLVSQEHKANPFPFYARLRHEAPVFHTSLPMLGEVWLVSRYDDVISVLKDERFVKDPRNAGLNQRKTVPQWLPESLRTLDQNMLNVDEPAHKRLRALVNKAFSRRGVEHMKGRIEAIADERLDAMAAAGSADLVKDFAQPLPLIVISELLGIPRQDLGKLHRWSKATISQTSQLSLLFSMPKFLGFVRYLRRLFEQRRQATQDDMLTALVQAEEDGDQLSANELMAMALLLIVAGHETTVNLIAVGVLALLQHPDQRDSLIREPELIGPAVEELLRFTSPVELGSEYHARETVMLHGVAIKRGERVLPVLASANRDETQFDSPDRLDLARDPNRHVALGSGIHFCLGAQLARMEGRIAFRKLFERIPGLELGVPAERLPWKKQIGLRGLESLPVKW